MSANPPRTESSEARNRLSITLSDDLGRALGHVSNVLGVPKASLCAQAVVDALPAWLDRAETIRKAARVAGGGGKR